MAAPSTLNERSQRQPFPKKASAAPQQHIAGDLIVMAALIGISRAFLGSKKESQVGRTVQALRETLQPDRGPGREADTPAEIPAKGWKDLAWRVYEGFQNDRVLLVAAGVTFYALLALFPATAAIVSLYGLFADAATINEHLRLVSGFLPDGALEVVGDQVKRIASQGQATLGFAHQFRGPDEETADCFAVQRGRRQGWLTPEGLEEVCKFMAPAKGDNMHFTGTQRCHSPI